MGGLICERRSYEEEPYTHAHGYAQLVVPIRGSMILTVDAEMLSDGRQKVIYLPPELRHCFHAEVSNQFFVFDIPKSYLPEASPQKATVMPVDERWQAIRSLLGSEVGGETASSQRLTDLFRYIYRLLEPGAVSPSREYIQDHYHEPLSLKQLAALEHYNPTYYCEWFQKQFGMTPHGLARRLRLEKARQLLRETDNTILQIAVQVGYEHESALIRLFRSELGMLPSEYRLKSRNEAHDEPN